jgi:hypothetical protein
MAEAGGWVLPPEDTRTGPACIWRRVARPDRYHVLILTVTNTALT